MASESARASSALEARFRVQAPNSAPRTTKVIALDEVSDAVVHGLSALPWQNAAFFSASRRVVASTEVGQVFSETAGADTSAKSARTAGDDAPELRDLEGSPIDVHQVIDSADLVVMVAGPGGHAHAARRIGQACRDQSVMTTALVVNADAAEESELSQTLAQLRPWALMVVVARGDTYVDDLMSALRV